MPMIRSVADRLADAMTTDPAYVDGDLVIAIPDSRGGLNVMKIDGRACEHLTARNIMPYESDDAYHAVEDLFTERDHDIARVSDITEDWTQKVMAEPQLLGMTSMNVHETSPDLRCRLMNVTFEAKTAPNDEAMYVDVDVPLTACQDTEGLTVAVVEAMRRPETPDLADDDLPL